MRDEIKKRLIVNADDFGLHNSVNEAVEIAHNTGILTSASLMVNGEGFEDAVAIAKKNKNLGVGIHLTLSGEKPVSPEKRIFSIVDSNGKLFDDHIRFCIRMLREKNMLKHIAIECEAQIDRFFQAGLKPTHVDSHRHLHLFPPIFKVLDPILKKYSIKKMRWINSPWFDYGWMGIPKIIFLLSLPCTKFLKNGRYKHSDYFIGIFRSGSMDISYLKKALVRLKPGTTEIGFHPGRSNDLIRKRYGHWKERHRWGCDWERELALLVNADIKTMITANDIALINYSQV